MLNKFGFLLVSVFTLFSSAIYASEDTDVLPVKQHFEDAAVCAAAVQSAGDEFGVSHDLLHTISVVESGRWDNLQQRFVAWPWTVNANGKGHYYETREQALEAIKNFQSQGIVSIDVGCMQINMKYHGDEFASVEEALDPHKNVQYSAKLLRSLYSQNGNNWEKAAKKYHSGNPDAGNIYSKRLEKRFESYKVAGLTQSNELF
ncbi:MAG: transglycosylase SLT domain-containing protein [Alphaproteobacteria bacterium]|nr:transglycosylase SLT domain-containing protein [Alphaproteobacteria bacterium]